MPSRRTKRSSSSSDDDVPSAKTTSGTFQGREDDDIDDWWYQFVQDQLAPRGLKRVARQENAPPQRRPKRPVQPDEPVKPDGYLTPSQCHQILGHDDDEQLLDASDDEDDGALSEGDNGGSGSTPTRRATRSGKTPSARRTSKPSAAAEAAAGRVKAATDSVDYRQELQVYNADLADYRKKLKACDSWDDEIDSWEADCDRAYGRLWRKLGTGPRAVTRDADADTFWAAVLALRTRYLNISRTTRMKKITQFSGYRFLSGLTASEFAEDFAESQRKLCLPVSQGGVGEHIKTSEFCAAIALAALARVPDFGHPGGFVDNQLTKDVTDPASLFQDLRLQTAMRPGPIVFDEELPSLFDSTNIAASGVNAKMKGVKASAAVQQQTTFSIQQTGGRRETQQERAKRLGRDYCTHCQFIGHSKKDCRKLKAERDKRDDDSAFRDSKRDPRRPTKREESKRASMKSFLSEQTGIVEQLVRKELCRRDKQSGGHTTFSTKSRTKARALESGSSTSGDSDSGACSEDGESDFSWQPIRTKKKKEGARMCQIRTTTKSKVKRQSTFASKSLTPGVDFVDLQVDSATDSTVVSPEIADQFGINVSPADDIEITAANDTLLDVRNRVDLDGAFLTESKHDMPALLQGVYSVKGIVRPLFSVAKATDAGHHLRFYPDREHTPAGQEFQESFMQLAGRSERIPIRRVGDAFVIRMFRRQVAKKETKKSRRQFNSLLHRRCAHASHKYLRYTKQHGLLRNFNYDVSQTSCQCAVCLLTNAQKHPFPKQAKRRAPKCGWRTHIDIKGPLPVKGRRTGSTSKADAVYAVIFTDDKSRRRVVKHLSNLKNLHRHVSEYIDHAERFGHVCRIFRFDQQFNTEAMGELQTERKFQIECSAAYCQSQDGVAEAGMKQWQKACRAILRDQNRDHVHWTDASNMLIKTLNRIYSSAAPEATPEEQWTKEIPDGSILRVPLCDAFFFKYADERKGTLDDRRTRGILVDYPSNERSYTILTADGRTHNRRYEDVKFDERSKLPKHEQLRARAVPSSSTSSNIEDSETSDDENVADDAPEPASHTDERDASSPVDSGDDSEIENGEGVSSVEPSPDNTAESNKPLLPTFSVTIDSTTTTWTASRIAKQHQISVDVLAEYNGDEHGNVHIQPKTKFRKGTTLNIPIFQVTDQHVNDATIEPTGLPTAKPNGHIKPTGLFAKSASTGYVFAVQNKKNGKYRCVNSEFDRALCEDAVEKINDSMGYIAPAPETTFITNGGLYAFNLQLSSILTPKNSKQAHSPENENSEDWFKAEHTELKTLSTKFDDVAIKDVKAAGHYIGHGMFHYRVKVDKLKARLCYDGSRQNPDSYDEIAASVLRYTTARMLMMKGVHYGNAVHTADVESAFLQRKCKRPFYMYYPSGYGKPGRCMQWNYMLYGRKDSPIEWLRCCTEFFASIGLVQNPVDPSVWTLKGDTPDQDFDVGVFVDDFCYQGPADKIAWFERLISKNWPVKLLGSVEGQQYLGMDVKIDQKTRILKINQRTALKKFVKSQGLCAAKPRRTPMDSKTKLVRVKGPCTNPALQTAFRQIVGALMHFAVVSRPDIAWCAVALSRCQGNPSELQLKLAQQVARYLAGSIDRDLTYDCSGDLMSTFICASDANWAENDDSTSTSGNVAFLGGAAISWLCSTQHCVAHSSCESEYIALDSMGREVEYLFMLLKSLHFKPKQPVRILEDNQSAIAMTAGCINHKRSKHITLRYHYIRQLVKMQIITVQYQPGIVQPADLLTKPLPREAFELHSAVVMGNHSQFRIGIDPISRYLSVSNG